MKKLTAYLKKNLKYTIQNFCVQSIYELHISTSTIFYITGTFSNALLPKESWLNSLKAGFPAKGLP